MRLVGEVPERCPAGSEERHFDRWANRKKSGAGFVQEKQGKTGRIRVKRAKYRIHKPFTLNILRRIVKP
jgi:hypothetical protein